MKHARPSNRFARRSRTVWLGGAAAFVAVAPLLLAAEARAACGSFAGSYSGKTVVDARQCEDGVKTNKVSFSISQKGCKVTVDLGGVYLRGTAKGNAVRVTGKYRDQGLITKNIVLTVKGNSISGKGRWTWTGSGITCGGPETITVTRR